MSPWLFWGSNVAGPPSAIVWLIKPKKAWRKPKKQKHEQLEERKQKKKELENQKNMFPELFQYGLCSKDFLNHVVFSPRVFFGFSCLLKMFPLRVLDQVQVTWLTHKKSASLKNHKQAHYQGPLFCFFKF